MTTKHETSNYSHYSHVTMQSAPYKLKLYKWLDKRKKKSDNHDIQYKLKCFSLGKRVGKVTTYVNKRSFFPCHVRGRWTFCCVVVSPPLNLNCRLSWHFISAGLFGWFSRRCRKCLLASAVEWPHSSQT